jgi:hypothetical protein
LTFSLCIYSVSLSFGFLMFNLFSYFELCLLLESSLAILIIFNYRYTQNNESVVCRSIRRGLLITRKLLNQGFYWLSWSHHFESCAVAIMTWSTATVGMELSHTVKPVHAVTSVKQSSVLKGHLFSWSVTEMFIWIEPL